MAGGRVNTRVHIDVMQRPQHVPNIRSQRNPIHTILDRAQSQTVRLPMVLIKSTHTHYSNVWLCAEANQIRKRKQIQFAMHDAFIAPASYFTYPAIRQKCTHAFSQH